MPAEELTPDLINELEQYRRILNNIPAEIGVLDPEGRYLFNTPSGIRDPAVREWMLGKTNHEWVRGPAGSEYYGDSSTPPWSRPSAMT